MLRGVRTTGGPVKDLRLGLGLLFLALLLTFYQQFQWQKSKWCNWICLQQKSYFAEKLEVCSMLSYVACRLMLAASVYCKPLMHPRLTFVPNAACHLDIMCFLALFDICRWGGGGVITSQQLLCRQNMGVLYGCWRIFQAKTGYFFTGRLYLYRLSLWQK